MGTSAWQSPTSRRPLTQGSPGHDDPPAVRARAARSSQGGHPDGCRARSTQAVGSAYLFGHREPDRYTRRDRLVAIFWPELNQHRARHALHQSLHFLRHHLGAGVLLANGAQEISVQPKLLWCDAVGFGDALGAGDAVAASSSTAAISWTASTWPARPSSRSGWKAGGRCCGRARPKLRGVWPWPRSAPAASSRR